MNAPSQLEVKESDAGILIRVRARAGARKNAITSTHNGALCISVTQAPERRKANAAITALLARQLGIPKRDVQIVSGLTNANKQFLLASVSLEQVNALVPQ